jgi:hypothetical protein
VFHDYFDPSDAKSVRSQINLLEMLILTAAQSSKKRSLFRFISDSPCLKIISESMNVQNKLLFLLEDHKEDNKMKW